MSNIDKIAERVLELGEKLARPAAETVLGAARIEAFSYVTSGLVAALVAGAAFAVARKLWRRGTAEDRSWNDEPYFYGGVTMYAVCGFAALLSATWLLDPWVYATLYDPSFYVAKRVIGL